MPKFRQNKWFSFNQLRINLGFGGLTRFWDGTGLKALFHATLFTGLKASASTEVLRTSSCWARKDISFPTLCFAKDGASFFLLILKSKRALFYSE